jgi:tetratricopeptide (TPR) repeat protein
VAGPDPSVQQALACLRAGQLDEALRLVAQRLQVAPDDGPARHLAGLVHLQRGLAGEALVELDRAARLQPGLAGVHYHRGMALLTLGQDAGAIPALDAALALQPDFAEAAFSRGTAYRRLGRATQALEDFRRAARDRPALAPAQAALGQAALAAGLDAEAAAAFERLVALEAADADGWNLLGVARHRLGDIAAALAGYDRALALSPGHADAWNNRGNAMHDRRDLAQALACFERALALHGDFPEAVANRGMVLQELGRRSEARAQYDQALALRPGYREALQRRAALNLLEGRLREGWADYEQGHAQAQHARAAPGAAPFWQGEDLRGRSLLLREPNGLGDTLQFFRFVPRLLERGVRLAFQGPRSLFWMLRPWAGDVRLIEDAGGERFDFQCWLWSLPHYLDIHEEGQLASALPSLQADEARVRHWRDQLDAERFNIGICWQGNPRRKIDAARSIPLDAFAPLSRLPGVRLVSLQKTHGLEQLRSLPEGMHVQAFEHFDEGPDAFADSAALLASLDLVVTADTSLTHVAAAMRRPTWLALNASPDWRWMLARQDSPWYPSVRLFRQQRMDDWAPVFEAMAAALTPRLAAGGPP